jgi:hypothetical protein
MKRARIATPVLILVVTTAAAAVVFGQRRPPPLSPDGSVAARRATVSERHWSPRSPWACDCKAAGGGELFLDGVKVADVPASTEWQELRGSYDRGDELRPVRGLFELRSGRTVATLQADVLRR